MNPKTFLPFLAATTLSGCLIVDGGPAPYRGDVSFSWTFAGLQCASVPQVASVRIQIPGEVLHNDGVFPCSTNGYSGILLLDFVPGPYVFTIDGLDYTGRVLYTASGSFSVNGSIVVTTDLSPVGGQSSYAYLMWTFPPNSSSQNPTCDQAGADHVYIRIDQGPQQRANCSEGFVQPGFQTGLLTPGTHQIELVGLDRYDYPYYRYVGTLQIVSGSPVSASYRFDWNIGGVSVEWQLFNGSMSQTCAQAGVQTISVNFQDSSGTLIYGAAGDPQPCTGAPILYNALLPGSYRVFVQGAGTGGTYRSSSQNPPIISVVAGQFVDATTFPVVVPAYFGP